MFYSSWLIMCVPCVVPRTSWCSAGPHAHAIPYFQSVRIHSAALSRELDSVTWVRGTHLSSAKGTTTQKQARFVRVELHCAGPCGKDEEGS